MSTQYFIAKTVQANEYVLLLGSKVVAGPFPTTAEAIKARDALLDARKPLACGVKPLANPQRA
jgi:hypothetical protein